MIFIQTFLLIVSCVYTVMLLLYAYNSGSFYKMLSINGASGAFLLIFLSVIKNFIGISLYVNVYTLSMSLIWGIPGVIMQIIFNIFFS